MAIIMAELLDGHEQLLMTDDPHPRHCCHSQAPSSDGQLPGTKLPLKVTDLVRQSLSFFFLFLFFLILGASHPGCGSGRMSSSALKGSDEGQPCVNVVVRKAS